MIRTILKKEPLRRLGAMAFGLALVAGTGACDGDGVTDPNLDLATIEGLYEVLTITFDPQGSAPASDVLAALESSTTSPTLNIGRTGNFQLFFRDPISGDVTTVNGAVETRPDGVDLVFPTQADADPFLFPRRLPLDYDAAEQTLSFSGFVQVSRARLLNLFPDVYADEQFFDPTPGILTVSFHRTDD